MQTKLSAQRFCCVCAIFTPVSLIVGLLYLCAATPVHAQSAPQISAGFNCQPGGEGSVAGLDFGSHLTVTVSINAQPVGEVTTEADGRLFFLIKLPAIALSGTYTVAVAAPLSATASATVTTTVLATDTFVVSYNAFHCVAARGVDEDGMIIEPQSVVLPDLAYHQFMPWIGR
ncbi:MAG: hypothetical protein R2867_17940 [Caldilineaceae bacterium]